MTVHWTQNALRHLRAIHDHIAQNSARYAQRMINLITRRSKELEQFDTVVRKLIFS